jgi:hypothetical protein
MVAAFGRRMAGSSVAAPPLQPMTKRSKSQIEATAYHEAGHTVIAYLLGYKPQSATIVPTVDTAGHIVIHANPLHGLQLDVDGSDEARLRVESAVTICFAGPIAQKCHNPRSWRKAHGQWDYDTIAELGLRVCGSGEQATTFIRWREIVARDMVQANWLRIALVAGQLLERERLSYADLDAIIVPRAGVIRVI